MLIGIDMLGVQTPGDGRESGRYGRQLVGALLARDPANRYVLYTHEGLPTDRVPPARNALRVSLAPAQGRGNARRAATQRLLDQNPDGLDWLLLLDPFDAGYGGIPPDAPINGPKVASVVHDFDAALDDERRMVPLRRHNAVLATSDPVAVEYRKRLGVAARRVSTIGLACEATLDGVDRIEPLTKVTGDELGRMGIAGPFLLSAQGAGSPVLDLAPTLDAYARLPIHLRRRTQLVVAGPLDDPDAVRSYLCDRGAEEGLVLTGEVGETSLQALYARCSAFIAPSTSAGPGLTVLEAMAGGASVIAERTPAMADLVGEAGILVDPSDRAGFVLAIDDLLSDPDPDLRRKALERSNRFSFEPVVEAVVAALGDVASTSSRIRVDRAHVTRPRIAVFPHVPHDPSAPVDLASQVPQAWRDSYAVDLYVEPAESSLIDGLTSDLGGFDTRLFERNDAILGYHAVAYRIGDATTLDATLPRMARRPGLVFLLDGNWIDDAGSPATPGGSDAVLSRVREVLRTGSRLAVPAPRHLALLRGLLPEFADQLVEIPPATGPTPGFTDGRSEARARLDLLPGSVVIGQFGRGSSGGSMLTPRGFKAITRSIPEVMVLRFDATEEASTSREAESLGVSERFVESGPLTREEARGLIPALDLAIHLGGSDSVEVLDLVKAGVATIALGSAFPGNVIRPILPSPNGGELARAVRELASDLEARASLSRSATAYCVGSPDPARASGLLVGEVERCAAELPRAAGGRRRPAGSPRGLVFSPHFARPGSAKGEASPRSR